jgi:hypothetical protein
MIREGCKGGINRMIVGFDFDGVICDIDIVSLKLLDSLEGEEYLRAERSYYASRRPLLNPEDFLAEGDEYYVLTARPEHINDISIRWLNKYCPNYKEFFCVGGTKNLHDTDHVAWLENSIGGKCRLIEKLDIEVYFEDNPHLAQEYRRRLDIPVVQYGGRLVYR